MILRWAALIAVKDPRLGKSRLSAALGDAERVALNGSLARRTLEVCADAIGAAACVVATAAPSVAADARQRGMRTVAEPQHGGLNAALAAAAREAIAGGAGALLVVPTDLARLDAAALRDVMRALPGDGGCVLVPDRHGTGTNAMALAPPRDDLFRFGPGSFRAHREAAAAAGLEVREYPHARIALDLDLPEDLDLWRAGAA